jgi:hypothetical protein
MFGQAVSEVFSTFELKVYSLGIKFEEVDGVKYMSQ